MTFQKGFMNDLTPKAVEVLGWLARGYRNDTIAEILERDVKTVERHINNIYASLQDEEDESKHPPCPGCAEVPQGHWTPLY